jgi:hypothetical protein
MGQGCARSLFEAVTIAILKAQRPAGDEEEIARPDSQE